MALIARYTGWTEHFILWELDLARGYAYAHAMMRMQNVKTGPVGNKERLYREIDEL